MRRFRFAAAFASLSLFVAARASAATAVDMQEHIFGASNVNAVSGHGGLTVGVSGDGDLSVLSWPNPTFADQLAYLASNDLNVRDEPHLGADDGMGSYLGLLVTTSDGKATLAFLRDPAFFTHSQRYTKPDSVVPETTFASDPLGLDVTLTDVVGVDVDVLGRHVAVKRRAGSAVTAVSLVVYENISPTVSELAEVPVVDWALDARNDFVAIYDATAKAIVHVHPGDRGVITGILDATSPLESVDYGAVDPVMQKSAPSDADVDALLAGIDTSFKPGVAVLVTTSPAPASFQVGSDATPICATVGHLIDNIVALPNEFPGLTLPLDPTIANALRCSGDPLTALRGAKKWQWAPIDALADLNDDHALSSSRVAAGETNGALISPLAFNGDVAEGDAFFAFGKSVAEARSTLAKGTADSFATRLAASEGATHTILGSIALPDPSLGDRVVAVAQRAIANIYVARDRGTGAIVASVSRQPPYFLDWPRDGSFFLRALDVAGLPDWATTRAHWYSTIQRRDPAPANPFITPTTTTDPDSGDQEFPAFSWEMNYYADGQAGGNIRFEIDNTALHVWATIAHAADLDPSARTAFLADVWPTTKDALDLLARWKDPTTKLPWPANEDDHIELTSTLHGATAVYAAIEAGARAAHAVGDEEEANALLARATELHAAILDAYFDPGSGLFHDTPKTGTEVIPGTTGTGSTAWVAWPARLLDPSDPRLEAQLAADLATVMHDIRGETEGGAYVMKNVVSAALLGKDGGSRDLAREAVTRLADIATPDTNHFGEVFVTIKGQSGAPPTFSARVAPPHVWEGTLFYLAAMALSTPSKFDGETSLPLPPSASSAPQGGGGCGCTLAGSETGSAGLFSIAIAIAFGARLSARRRAARRGTAGGAASPRS